MPRYCCYMIGQASLLAPPFPTAPCRLTFSQHHSASPAAVPMLSYGTLQWVSVKTVRGIPKQVIWMLLLQYKQDMLRNCTVLTAENDIFSWWQKQLNEDLALSFIDLDFSVILSLCLLSWCFVVLVLLRWISTKTIVSKWHQITSWTFNCK